MLSQNTYHFEFPTPSHRRSLSVYQRVGHLALPYFHPVHRYFRQAVVVDERAGQHEHVEDLVRVQPNVKLAWKPGFKENAKQVYGGCTWEEAFRYSHGVHDGAEDVQHAHEHEPAEVALRYLVEPALDDGEVDGGHDAAEAERHEDAGAQRPPRRLRELVPEAHEDAAEAQDGDARQVQDLSADIKFILSRRSLCHDVIQHYTREFGTFRI